VRSTPPREVHQRTVAANLCQIVEELKGEGVALGAQFGVCPIGRHEVPGGTAPPVAGLRDTVIGDQAVGHQARQVPTDPGGGESETLGQIAGRDGTLGDDKGEDLSARARVAGPMELSLVGFILSGEDLSARARVAGLLRH
jgi:hypothetical protein